MLLRRRVQKRVVRLTLTFLAACQPFHVIGTSAVAVVADSIESGREIPSTPPTRASTVFALHPLSVHEQVNADGYNAWRTGVIGITVGGVVGGVFGYLGSAYGCGDPGCDRAHYVIMGAVIGAAVGLFVEYAFRDHPKCPVLDGCGP